ncbi:MAG: cytochrome c3 family protein [Candidatus Aminicenantes bacterium]
MKKKKKKRLIIILSAAGFFLILFLASVEYTSHSKFCSTCHYMKPFYQSWKTSSHSHIECNTCHYPPGVRSKLRAKVEGLLQLGRYWTKLYLKSKPWAEIPDESCLRQGCHEKRLLEGRVKFKKVVFDHKIHLTDLQRGKRLRCTSCHSQIVQGEHITVTESTCFICHFKKSEHFPRISDCSHCHHKEDLISEKTSRFNHSVVFSNGFSCDKCHSHIIVGDGDVPRENCYKCHWETDRLNKYHNTDLMHSTHITDNKIECNLCHLEIQHKIVKEIEAIANCQACHTDYHKAQKILFTGEGGKGIHQPYPNIMLEKGLSCKGCHIFHEESGGKVIKSETLTSKAQACESCHGKGFARIMKDWKISTQKKLDKITSIYKRASQQLRLTKNGEKEKEKSQRLLEEAYFNMDIVERGKSVHNIEYAQKLLSVSYDKIVEALDVIGSSYKPESFLGEAKEIPTQCSNCHAGIEEIDRNIFGLNFPHKKHLIEQKIQCSTCHSNVRKHGEFVATKQSCAACHHRDPKKDCTVCHQIQKTLYKGGTFNGLHVSKDIMAEAEVSCVDCHTGPEDRIYRSDRSKCVECHGEGYGEIFTEWQKSTQTLIRSINNSLKETENLKLIEQEKDQILKINQILGKIELDGSSGIHNYMSIEEILTQFQKILESFPSSPPDSKNKT